MGESGGLPLWGRTESGMTEATAKAAAAAAAYFYSDIQIHLFP